MRPAAPAIFVVLSLLSPVANPARAVGDGAASDRTGRILDDRTSRSVGLTTGWQSKLPLLAGTDVQGVELMPSKDGKPEGESLYAWDRAGVVMKLDPRSGQVRWTSAAVTDRDKRGFLDVLPATIRVRASNPDGATGSDASASDSRPVVIGLGAVSCLALDDRSGLEEGWTPYRRIPSTEAVPAGSDFVYGSRSGEVVWITFREEVVPSREHPAASKAPKIAAIHVLPLELHAHGLRGPIQVAPVVAAGRVLACTTSGRVACFAAETRRLVWQMDVPGGVVASPAVAGDRAFIASRDQYLRCVDLTTSNPGGAVLWKWFTETPLERPPFISGNLLTIHVDGRGLVALDANPSNAALTRDPLWTSKATGDAITCTQDGLLTWDAESHTLSLVETETGAVRESLILDDVAIVKATAPTNGEILLVAADGRVQRCAPLHPLLQPAKSAAPAPVGDAAASASGEVTTPAEAPASEKPSGDAPGR